MADIIQFPSKEKLLKNEEAEMLNRHLALCEQDIQIAMQQLDELNEEILQLTNEYTSILHRLKKLLEE